MLRTGLGEDLAGRPEAAGIGLRRSRRPPVPLKASMVIRMQCGRWRFNEHTPLGERPRA